MNQVGLGGQGAGLLSQSRGPRSLSGSPSHWLSILMLAPPREAPARKDHIACSQRLGWDKPWNRSVWNPDTDRSIYTHWTLKQNVSGTPRRGREHGSWASVPSQAWGWDPCPKWVRSSWCAIHHGPQCQSSKSSFLPSRSFQGPNPCRITVFQLTYHLQEFWKTVMTSPLCQHTCFKLKI